MDASQQKAPYDPRNGKRGQRSHADGGFAWVPASSLRQDQRDQADLGREAYRHALACRAAVGGKVTPGQLKKMLNKAEHLVRRRQTDKRCALLSRQDLVGCLGKSERCRRATLKSIYTRLGRYIRAAVAGGRLILAGDGFWELRWHGTPPKPVDKGDLHVERSDRQICKADGGKRILARRSSFLLTTTSRKTGHGSWQKQGRLTGGRFGARRPPPIFRPEAGSAAPQPPSLEDNSFSPCNPEPVPVQAPSPEPTPAAEVAGAVVTASANAFLARAQAVQARVSRETIAERERRWAEAEARHAATKARIPAQGGHHVTSPSVRDALATAPVLRAVARPDAAAVPVELGTPRPPPRGARRQLRAQVPQAERRVHDRAMVRLAEALGTPTLTPDEHRLCRSAASDADLAVIFGRVGDPTSLARMRRAGLSAAAWYQAREHMAHSGAVGVRDWRAVLCHAARRYQAYFDGRDGGWSPYAAYRRAARNRHHRRVNAALVHGQTRAVHPLPS